MTIYVDIDTNPDPDCYDDLKFVLYVLRPPREEYPMVWNDDESVLHNDDDTMDNDEAERFICLDLGLGLRRSSSGCYARRQPPPDNISGYLAMHGVIVNKIGERLDENC